MKAAAFIDEQGDAALSGITAPVPWWSFTKTVLAIAVLRLVEKHMAGLDEPLSGQPYTLRQLLRHEAGLPDYGALPQYHADVAIGNEPWPVDQLLQSVDADRLLHAPGTGWAYSNIGYLKVAQIIEQASGLTLSRALSRLVFEPAGVESARLAIQVSDLSEVQMGGADGYHPGWVYHDLVTGTVADAARLLWQLATGRLLQPGTLANMLDGRALPQHRSINHPDPAYGLGIMHRAHDPADHPFGHGGEGPGSRIAVYALGHRAASVWISLPSDGDAETDAFQLLGR